MPLNQDFLDMLRHLNAEGARYLIVGAYAVIHHTEPRYTKDIDIWVKPDLGNAQKVYRALANFGAPMSALTVEDLTEPDIVFQIGVEPNRIDILTGVGGLNFDSAWKNRSRTHYGEAPINVLGIEDSIRTKKKAGRSQDRVDIEELRLAKKIRKRKKK